VPTDLHVLADGPHAVDSMSPDTAVARRAARVLETGWNPTGTRPTEPVRRGAIAPGGDA
jgi:hypothetical protein